MLTREQAITLLKAAGISPSEPRLAIFMFIQPSKEHPTVDSIFKKLNPIYPTLSKTTVYNTLKLFLASKLITAFNLEDGQTHFDPQTHFHAHFRCIKCGEIIDVEGVPEPSRPDLPGASFLSSQINYFGICQRCNEAEKK